MSIKFKNPPINELVIGVYFERELHSLRSEHIGLFWGKVRDDFPNIQQKPPVPPPALGPLPPSFLTIEFSQMPRFWFEAADGSTLMQIQGDAFLFNWRKRGSSYPHFDVVKNAFDENKRRFFRFIADELGEAEPKSMLAELTYINVIERCKYWGGFQDTRNVIPLFRLPIPDLNDVEPPDFQQITSQRLGPDLTLTTAVRSARSAQDSTKPVLTIDYRATGLLREAGDADRWFDRAHDAIGHCFTNMTNPDIQNTYWQPM